MIATPARVPRSAVAFVSAFTVTAILSFPGPARASTLIGGPVRADTLDVGAHVARQAVIETLSEKHWLLDISSTQNDTLETAWQPVRSFAVRLLVGDVKTRCQLTCDSLPGGRTRVAFRALALAERPVKSASLRRAGEKANDACARDWFARLRLTAARLAAVSAESVAAQIALRTAP